MRRKSERNKSKPAEKKSEPSPKKSRRSSRRRKRSSSRSSSEDSDDVPLKVSAPEVVEPEVSPPSDEQKKPESHSNSDEDKQEHPIWKVKTTEAPSGEIQKLKICLQRPSTTPERTEKSPRRHRGKASSQSDDASITSDDRPHGKKKNRRSSPYSSAAEGSSLDNTAIEVAEKEETITINTETNEVEIGQGKLDRSQKDQESENADSVQDSRTEEGKNESLKQSETNEEAAETAGEQIKETKNEEQSQEVEIVTAVQETVKDPSPETEQQKEKDVEDSKELEEKGSDLSSKTVLEKIEKTEEKEQIDVSENVQQSTGNEIKMQEEAQVSDKQESQEITQPETIVTQDNEIQKTDVIQKTTEICSTKNQVESLEKTEIQETNVLPETDSNSSIKIRCNSSEKDEDPEATLKVVKTEEVMLKKNKDVLIGKITTPEISEEQESNENSKSSESAMEIETVAEKQSVKDEGIADTDASNINNTTLEVKTNTTSETETLETSKDIKIDIVNSKNESTEVHTAIEKSSENDTSVDSKPESPEALIKPEQVEECITAAPFVRPERKRKWGKYKVTLKEEDRITSESITLFMPSFKFLAEEKLKLEPEEVKERKIPKKEREVTIYLPISPKHEDDSEREFSTIGLNRKISIVNDEASKLQPPPSPAKNTTSAILYITNLVRPFTLKQLQELLSRTGKIVEDGFWTDKIKSRCYVQYETDEEAEATRNALHGVQWPTGNGKKLVIDFGTTKTMDAARKVVVEEPTPVKEISEKVVEKVPEFEKKDVVANNDRWDKARAAAPVREWDLGKISQEHREKERERSRSKDRGHLDRDRNRPDKRRPGRNESPSNGDHVSPRKRKKDENEVKLMDDLFHKTKATPSIYWLPLSPDQIAKKQQQRLQRMAEHKRRMEESRRTDNRDFGRGGQQRNRRRPNRYDGD